FAGLLTFIDPPRKGVFDAVKICKDSGIHVLMITGDHPETACAIAREIGLGDGEPNVLLGEDVNDHLHEMNSDFFRRIDVIAR
ncbi:HAD family hydrolase, partial [Acinetobacter baumannii]